MGVDEWRALKFCPCFEDDDNDNDDDGDGDGDKSNDTNNSDDVVVIVIRPYMSSSSTLWLA